MLVKERKPLPVFARNGSVGFAAAVAVELPVQGMARISGVLRYGAAPASAPSIDLGLDGSAWDLVVNFLNTSGNIWTADVPIQGWRYARVNLPLNPSGTFRCNVQVHPTNDAS